MDVLVAKCAGACYGVQRALEMARAAAVPDGAYTLGPLIHNPRVVGALEQEGVHARDSLDDLSGLERGTVVIRSHGVAPEVRDALAALGLPLVDATCPHVLRAQRAAAAFGARGLHVLCVGEPGHPEVEGIAAHARREGAPADIVPGAADLPETLHGPVGVVVQTTQKPQVLEEVERALAERGVGFETCRTICSATQERQDAAAKLAGDVDAFVVVGGRNSSNTTRLAEICAQSCPRTYHVESEGELDSAWFAGCGRVGVTAGASTPEEHLRAVVECLERM